MSTYVDREQTEAKHFILRAYLQELAFKVMHAWDSVAYIDGFSGPWESATSDFSDTSFMIAISVLKDAQESFFQQTGKKRKVKCFFAENDRKAYAQLEATVAPHHRPSESFEVKTFFGDFEEAVTEIRSFTGPAFPLIFIDPTGWTVYPFDKIKPLFAPARCEVLINFMYDFINRASGMGDAKTVASLDPILGGAGWINRLDANLPRGLAVEKLFRETLAAEGGFKYVVSTCIEKSTADRPHFFLAYGTKDRAGLRAFRDIEFKALRAHAKNRAGAKERKREERSLTPDLFAVEHIEAQADTIDVIVKGHKASAQKVILGLIDTHGSLAFEDVVDHLLQEFMLRETDVKDICVVLAKENLIENTWGSGNRKPCNGTPIHRKVT